MTGRGGRRGRRGGRSHSNHDPQSSSDSDTESRAKMPKEEATVKLDPNSFRELALSCKAFFHFCLNTRGIAIVSPIKIPELALNNGSINFFNSRCRICRRNNGSYKKHLKTLSKWPFVISIDTFYANVWADRLEEVKQVLQTNGVKKIGRLDHEYTPTTVQQLAVITNFLRTFDVKTIMFRHRRQGALADDVIHGILNMPVTEMHIPSWREDLDIAAILDSRIPSLSVSGPISHHGMEAVLQIWKTRSDFVNWTFRHHFDFEEFTEYFNRFEVRFFGYEGPIDRSHPPVFLSAIRYGSIDVYILRNDGKVICVSLGNCIQFHMCPIDQGPLALRDL